MEPGSSHSRISETAGALTSFDALPDLAFARLPMVAALFATSQANVWRWVRTGRIPRPYKLGPQTTAWKVGDLRRALRDLEADR